MARRRTTVDRTVVATATIVVLVVLTGGIVLRHSARAAQRAFEERFEARAVNTAGFIGSYVESVAALERRQAERFLGGAVTADMFNWVVTSLEFDAAVLLDGEGRAKAVWPPRDDLLGVDLTERYAHLAAAHRGSIGVSSVVPSAARGAAIVAVASPFESERGQWVISGAFAVGRTPIGRYLDRASPIPTTTVHVVDASGTVIASTGRQQTVKTTLAAVAPKLERAAREDAAGHYDVDGKAFFFSAQAVPGTPWRVVLAVPERDLLAPLEGSERGPLSLLAALAALGLVILVLVTRLVRTADVVEELSRTDVVTGLPNRRAVEAALGGAIAGRARPLAVLMLDLDHFKRVNDTAGHEAGDALLRAVGDRIRDVLRVEASVGRWGGEEFVAVLPGTSATGAVEIAERVRAAVAEPIVVPGHTLRVTVSLGVSVFDDETDNAASVVARADAALYEAKRSGRDQVRVDPGRGVVRQLVRSVPS